MKRAFLIITVLVIVSSCSDIIAPDPSYITTPFTITSIGNTSVAIMKKESPQDIYLEYRKGDKKWAQYSVGIEIDLFDGETLQFRAGEQGNYTFSGEDAYSDGSLYYISARGNGNISVSGNIMSLLDRTCQRNNLLSCAFCELFCGCDKLIDASYLILPATNLADRCYSDMFEGCTSLTKAPVLPATNLADNCYWCMFNGCTSLTEAPVLPATNLADNCYCGMFGGGVRV